MSSDLQIMHWNQNFLDNYGRQNTPVWALDKKWKQESWNGEKEGMSFFHTLVPGL